MKNRERETGITEENYKRWKKKGERNEVSPEASRRDKQKHSNAQPPRETRCERKRTLLFFPIVCINFCDDITYPFPFPPTCTVPL